jgi:hypothetical protein
MRLVSTTRGRTYIAVTFVLLVAPLAIIIAPSFQSPSCTTFSYTDLLVRASSGQIASAAVVHSTGTITGDLFNGASYCVKGPTPVNQADMATLQRAGVTVTFTNASSGILSGLLPYAIVAVLASLTFILLWLIKRSRRRLSRATSVPST